MDVVITTAQVPGRRPPLLVTAKAVEGMKPGSVIVDMAASALGGNVELSKPDETVVTDNGVTILAPDEPAGDDAGRREPVLCPQHVHVPPPFHEGRRDGLRPGRRDPGGHGHHPRRRSRAGGDEEAPPAGRGTPEATK